MAPDVKVGVVPLRPLGLGEVLDGAIATIRGHWRPVLLLSAAVAAIQALLSLAITLSTDGLSAYVSTDESFSGGFSAGFAPFFSLAGVLGLLVSSVLGFILAGMVTIIVGEAVLGRPVMLSEVWARARKLLLPLMGASLIAGIVPYLGLVAFIVGGVFLWTVLALTTPALMLERTTVRGAIRRSWRLTLPDFWRVLGIRILAVIIAAFVSNIISLPFAIPLFLQLFEAADGGDTSGVLGFVLLTVGTALAATVTAPFTAAVLALLYIDRRMRAEGLDVALQETARAAAAGSRSTARPPM